MSEDHIGVQINGALYVKFEDAKKLREGWDKADAENEKLRAALKDMAKHIWRGDWGKLDPETRALMGEKE